jgi:hypothetical protein
MTKGTQATNPESTSGSGQAALSEQFACTVSHRTTGEQSSLSLSG